jgi:hypothetical protein
MAASSPVTAQFSTERADKGELGRSLCAEMRELQQSLIAEMHALHEETKQLRLALHGEIIARLTVLQETLNSQKRYRIRRPRRK